VGEQIGAAVEGRLYYVPRTEFERVRSLQTDRLARAAVFADMCRLNALYMIARAGSGHIGSSFSSLDIVSWLVVEELRFAEPGGGPGDGDLYFSSKGHDAPGYYSALIGAGRLDFELLHRLRRLDGLPGHPDVGTPGIVTNTGSLGMGISKAKGMVRAHRLRGRRGRVFVMTGDGELQEGQFWESLLSAANDGLHEITAIVDHNTLQSDTFVSQVSDLGDLTAKLRAFGWYVDRCDGHNLAAFSAALARANAVTDQPKILIADTVKGRGVSFMEHTAMESDATLYRFHSGAPDSASYTRAAQELIARVRCGLDALGAPELVLAVDRPASPAAAPRAQRLIPTYSEALLAAAATEPRLVALDADLVLDTGLIPFRQAHPERFIECGIAEQDMVSQAGGLALQGLLPAVHSFACFLTARANEQIYNNATERTKILYVGSLAGVVPGGPGHSHQAVRDIAALGAVPGLEMIEPCNATEVAAAVAYAVHHAAGSCYLRLTSIPVETPFELPANYRLEPGRGTVLRQGRDAVVIGYGPVLLTEAMLAAEQLSSTQGREVTIVNLPWLNRVDVEWLRDLLADVRLVCTLDNHYVVGGQGDRVCSALVESGASTRVLKIGLTDIPPCGTNAEVLRACGLDAASLAARIGDAIG